MLEPLHHLRRRVTDLGDYGLGTGPINALQRNGYLSMGQLADLVEKWDRYIADGEDTSLCWHDLDHIGPKWYFEILCAYRSWRECHTCVFADRGGCTGDLVRATPLGAVHPMICCTAHLGEQR